MTLTQLTNYLMIALLILVAVCEGIHTALDFYIKKAQATNKPVPKQLMSIDEIAKFVVDEAATLDISGAEKKAKAVQDLLNQAKAEGKPVTEEVAKGAVQHAYNATQKDTGNTSDTGAQSIGFVSDDTNDETDEK